MQLSVVIPVHDEAENIRPLLAEITDALRIGIDYEIVVVDDGSRDQTPTVLTGALQDLPRLRVLRHLHQAGQSAALRTGVRHARGKLIATLDGDGQNDPADIPRLLALFAAPSPDPALDLVTGHRVTRKDSVTQRCSSRIANAVRSRLLHDATPDTGCGLKVFPREVFLDLPYFDHMHRFLPALVVGRGGQVRSVPVGHRPRRRGRSHYGIHDRLWVGLVDLMGVAWLQRRSRPVTVVEVDSTKEHVP